MAILMRYHIVVVNNYIRGYMKFSESNTFKNILKTLDGELKASTKYEIYAMKAKEDGYEQIGNIFDETSGNEREHAEIMMKLIHNGEVPDTLTNLKDSISGENAEWTNLYKGFAEEARQEGYDAIGRLFDGIASIEEYHEFRYGELAKNLEQGTLFCKEEQVWWICLNCGYIYCGECAPKHCPVCGYPQGYFELYCRNY